MGGALKRCEKLSARLGDILSALYLMSATLKRYEVEGRQATDAPLVHWAIWDTMYQAQQAFEGAIKRALAATIAAEPVEVKIRTAEREGCFAGNPRANVREIAELACELGVIGKAEYELVKRRNRLRDIVVRVDDFPLDFGRGAEPSSTERLAA